MRRFSFRLALSITMAGGLSAGFILQAAPSLADDIGAIQSRVLFRELKTVAVDAEQVYHLTAWQKVNDSSYQLRYNNQFPGEQMSASAGGQIQIQLVNRLTGFTADQLAGLSPPVVGRIDGDETREMIAKASSITNLHTHGLHVSPGERSDNVMLKINQGRHNLYTIDLPEQHAPGTHWYHAHLHGSTALQVQGGMAGALLVNPRPGQSLNPPGFRVQERVMVLQFGDGWEFNQDDTDEAANRTLDMAGLRSLKLPAESPLKDLIAVESEEELRALANRLDGAALDDLADSLGNLRPDLPPVLVNGLENSVLEVQQDVAVQRFRVINAGSRKDDYKSLWIESRSAPGESLPMYVGAFDGVNLTELPKSADGKFIAYTKERPLELAPGNRADIFVIPHTAGEFVFMMEGEVGIRDLKTKAPPAADEVSERLKFRRPLVRMEVGGPDLTEAIAKTAGSATEAEPFLRALDLHLQKLQSDIPAYHNGYLRPFQDHGDYIERKIRFNIEGGGTSRQFLINERSYNSPGEHGHMAGHSDYLGKEEGDGGRGPNDQTPWPLRSGTEEQWTITNESGVVHPFHIHVSPFWIVDIVEEDADKKLVSVKATNPYDPRLNRWQDTVTLPPNGGSVTVRHRVSQFTGLYVIHCHILQHEDRGMMINVLTVPNSDRDPQAFFEQVNRRNAEINCQINGGC